MSTTTPYKTTVGIEVHAELKTKSKMFCGCKNAPHTSKPNENICEVCTAQPGTLPTVNKDAVEKVLLVGNAIGATLADYSEFDRKNYFYPDIPKAYQISQYAFPLVTGGEVDGVAITRIHLEEDTARSQHEGEEGSLVDFNRAGVPLMELVTEPVIHSGEEAAHFGRELQLLLQLAGVSDANMEKGEMRVEANISVSKDDTLGTKVEVKNLNSFKVVQQAIEYETKRQIDLLESGDKITQETRGWDDARSKTYSQRSKESAEEYRYFPDPDIVKYKLFEIQEFSKARLDEKTPKLASELRDKYKNLGLTDDQASTLLQDEMVRIYFTEVSKQLQKNDGSKPIQKLAANYLTSDILAVVPDHNNLLPDESIPEFVKLLILLESGEIGSRAAKDILVDIIWNGAHTEKLIEEKGLKQNSSEDFITELVAKIITENETAVAEYRGGKEAALKFLVGNGMKLSKGAANPQVLEAELMKQLS